MKKLILLLSPLLILALVVAGCAPADQSVPEEAPGAQVTAEEPGAAPEAGGMATEEPAAGMAETPAAAEDVEAGAVTTEEPSAAPEAGGMATEEPVAGMAETPAAAEEVEASGMATEEPVAGMAETPAAEEVESAQASEGVTDESEVIPPTGAADLSRMSNLLDFEVWNNNNEQIGSVNAIVINQDTSQIEYVIVGSGGLLGLGEKELPVPWQVLQLKAATAMEAESSVEGDETQAAETPQDVFILDLSQEELEQVPDFDLTSLYEQPQVTGDETQAPEAISLQELEQEIQSYWQSEPTAQMSDTKNLVLAEDLLGATVRNQAAGISEQSSDTTQEDLAQAELIQDLGFVEEIMVDLNTGKVTYLLISLNAAPTVGLQEPPAAGIEATPAEGVQEAPAAEVQEPLTIQAVPVPLEALEWNAEEGVFIYTGSQPLEDAPTIDLEQFELDQSFNWMSEADSFWGMEESPESETE